jgi:transposase
MRRVEKVKIVEILRLSEKGMTQRAIGAVAGCGKSTVGDVLMRCKNSEVTYETAKKLSDDELTARLYPANKQPAAPEPDWKTIHEEMAKRPKLNLQYMWEEYRRENPNGLSYPRFCVHAKKYRETTGREVTYIKERKAGDIMEVDWMGDTLACVVNRETGELQEAHFFVSTLGYSHYPYVEAFPDEKEQNWITANVNALHYYGGVPGQIAPDNCKTAVITPRYYEPVINSAYWELAQHYEVAIIPARVRKPKDKAAVESSVGWLETWLLERLRNQRFFSFAELNKAIRKYMGELSARPFQKRPGSRYSEFVKIDKPALKPLPAQKYETADVKHKKVPDNYHLEYDGFYYSVPFRLHGEYVTLRATAKTIEVLDKDRVRVASHPRKYDVYDGRYSSLPEHMPPNHQAMHRAGKFDGVRYRNWARNIGENTYFVIESILSGYKMEQQGYKSCMGILQSAKHHGKPQLEEACRKAREIGSCTYATVKMYLKNGMKSKPKASPTPSHENIRGSAYYR